MEGWCLFRTSRLRRQKGGQIIEYSLLLSLIVIVCISGINAISHGTRKTFCAVLIEKSTDQMDSSNYDPATGECWSDGGGAARTQYF